MNTILLYRYVRSIWCMVYFTRGLMWYFVSMICLLLRVGIQVTHYYCICNYLSLCVQLCLLFETECPSVQWYIYNCIYSQQIVFSILIQSDLLDHFWQVLAWDLLCNHSFLCQWSEFLVKLDLKKKKKSSKLIYILIRKLRLFTVNYWKVFLVFPVFI